MKRILLVGCARLCGCAVAPWMLKGTWDNRRL
jgi:hypothetical protein